MKHMVAAGLLLFTLLSDAQVVNRYPNIQSPDQTSAIIAWRRATSAVGSVKWGTAAGSLTNTLTESSANQIHAITISGLQPNTKYYYQALSDTFTSAVEYFYTAKPDSVRQLSFVVYGDCGFNSSQQNSISALMATRNVDFGLVVGDVDQNVGNDYDTRFFQRYKDILKHLCHFTAIGNHDVITNNTNYVNAFHLPHNNAANSEQYYSFTWGNAKFITINGNDTYTVGSAQYNWLENELKCNDQEWVFVYFHQPPWSNGWDASYYIPFTPFYQYQGNVDMRTSIVPLFEKYHVDAVLNGHTHNYERGIYNGVRYFITGGAGGTTLDQHTNSNSPNIQFEQSVNHFMQFSINGNSVHYNTIDINGNIIDSATFSKSFTPYQDQLTVADASCLAANGTAAVSVAGPHPPYTLTWSNGSHAGSLSTLSPGSYTVTVADTNQCTKVKSFSIQNKGGTSRPSLSAAGTHLCVGDSLLISATPGFNSYLWNNGQNTASTYVYSGGSFFLSAKDSFGCTVKSDTVSVQSDSISHLQIATNTLALAAYFSGSVTGLGSYVWDFGDGHGTTTSTPAADYIYTDSGSYTVKLITQQACGNDTATVTVHVTKLNTGVVYLTGDQIHLSLIPNPFRSSAQLSIEKNNNNEAYNAQLFDLNGRLISDLGTTTNNQLTIQRGNLAAGEYVLLLNNEKHRATLKVVIE